MKTKPTWLRILARILRWTGITILALLLLILLILTIGPSIKVNGLRPKIAGALTNGKTRDVSISGDLHLKLSFRPAVRIQGLVWTNPRKPAAPPFIEIRDMWARLARGGTLAIKGSGAMRSVPLELDATTGTIKGVIERNGKWPIRGIATLDGAVLNADGYLEFGTKPLDMAFEGSGKGTSLQPISDFINRPLPDKDQFALDFTFTRRNGLMWVRIPQGTLEDTALTVALEMGKVDGEKHFHIAAEADALQWADIATILRWSPPSYAATFGHAAVVYEYHGATPEAKAAATHLAVTGQNATITYRHTGSPDVWLDHFEIEQPAGSPISMALNGAWLGKTLSAKGQIGNIADWRGTNVAAIAVQLDTEGFTGVINGGMAKRVDGRHLVLDVSASGERLGDLSAWIGINPSNALPYRITTTVKRAADGFALEGMALKLGESSCAGEIRWDKSEDAPRLVAALHSPLLDLDDLSRHFARVASPTTNAVPSPVPSTTAEEGNQLDLPILPEKLNLPNMDLLLEIDTTKILGAITTETIIRGVIADGNLESSQIRYRFAGAELDGRLALLLGDEHPRAELHVQADDVDVGQLLRAKGLAENLQLYTERLTLHARAEGQTLAELLDWSALDCTLTNGVFVYPYANSTQQLDLVFETASLSATTNHAVLLTAQGSIDETPVTVRLESYWPLPSDFRGTAPLRFEIAGDDETLTLTGSIDVPFDGKTYAIGLAMEGQDVADLSAEVGPRLPSMGPYALAANLEASPEGYALTNLHLSIGSTAVDGTAFIKLGPGRPRVDVAIESERIQLDDLALKAWFGGDDTNAVTHATVKVDAPGDADADQASGSSNKLHMASRIFRELDASVQVRVQDLYSGEDRLGGGSIGITLEDQHLVVDPFHLEIPGGSLDVGVDYAQLETGVVAKITANVDEFDYGVLARRYSAESTVGGLIDVKANITSQAESLARLMAGANGYLAFLIRPDQLDARIFDMWAANLITALVPALDKKADSTVNCVAGSFEIEEGLLTQRTLTIDTSRVRVKGKARVDFDTDTLSMKMKPKSKQARFFSLGTPVGVKGTLEKPELDLSGWDVTKSAFGFVFSIVTVPFKLIFSNALPADGTELCIEQLEGDLEKWEGQRPRGPGPEPEPEPEPTMDPVVEAADPPEASATVPAEGP